jgi:hypothetical protein
MNVKRIYRGRIEKSPQGLAIQFAAAHGFVLQREPFGKRGSLIEVYRADRMVGYRKSYTAALRLMQAAQ